MELRNKMPLCHFSIYTPGRFIQVLKTCIKNQNIQKNKSKFERLLNGGNDQFTCQECRKVQITERIFPKELENLFKLEKFSNYRDSNYGKKIIIVSLG